MVNYYGLEWVRLGQTLATVRLVGRKKPTLGLQMRDRSYTGHRRVGVNPGSASALELDALGVVFHLTWGKRDDAFWGDLM